MTYIEAHSELRDHPKTKLLKRVLGTSIAAVVGHLQCLWWWVMDYAPSGDLTGYPNAVIANAAEWEGDPDAFVNALLGCSVRQGGAGFLEFTEGGRLVVHDWHDYGGKLICRRWVDAYRKRVKRLPTLGELKAADLPLPSDELIPVGWYDQSRGKSAPAPPSGIEESNGCPTDIQRMSDLPPDDRVRSVAKRSVAKPNVAYRSVAESSSSPPTPQGGEIAAAAANADASGGAETTFPDLPEEQRQCLPLPGENPATYVKRVLPLLPKHWPGELEKRFAAAQNSGRASHEWPWKRKVLVDWVTGAEPAPEGPRTFRVKAAPPDGRDPAALVAAVASRAVLNGASNHGGPRSGQGMAKPPALDAEARQRENEAAREWLAGITAEERERITAEEREYVMAHCDGGQMGELLLTRTLDQRVMGRALLAVREANYSVRNNPASASDADSATATTVPAPV